MSEVERHESVASWPSWTDAERWEANEEVSADPSPEDAAWLAEQNESWHSDEPLPDADYDREADEAEAQSRYENGNLL